MKYSVLASALMIVAICLASCSEKKSDEGDPEVYFQANEVHQNSLDLREEIMDMEKSLKEADIDFSALKDELKIWDKEIIEVPGYEHSHDDGEYHRKYHVHNRMKPFSDQEHLEYQKSMHEEIKELHESFRRLLVEEIMDEES